MNSRAIRRLSNSIRKLHGTVTMIIRMCTYYAMLVVKKKYALINQAGALSNPSLWYL